MASSSSTTKSMTVHLAIAGTRKFNDYPAFCQLLDNYLKDNQLSPSSISSTGASGTDAMALKYAREHKITAKLIRASHKVSSSKGTRRSDQLIDECTHFLAFTRRAGNSKASNTGYTIELAKQRGVPVEEIEVDV